VEEMRDIATTLRKICAAFNAHNLDENACGSLRA
jgi:hypothetical protein